MWGGGGGRGGGGGGAPPAAPPPPTTAPTPDDVVVAGGALLQRRELTVCDGKGGKDRVTLLPQSLVPALRALGVPRLDGLVVSHGDNDHAGGVDAVRDSLPVRTILAPPGSPVARGERRVIDHAVASLDIEVLANDIVCFALTPILALALIEARLNPMPYLLALAVHNQGRLVTFDQRIPLSAVHGATPAHLVVL